MTFENIAENATSKSEPQSSSTVPSTCVPSPEEDENMIISIPELPKARWWRPTRSSLIALLNVNGLLFSSILNSLFFKKMTSSMPNYSLFLNQITSMVYIPIFLIICYFSKISKETTEFPKRHFLLMGLLDAFSGALVLLGGVHTSGPAQISFNQAAIPVSLVLSIIFLGKRYNLIQFFGAFLIIAGVVITKIFQLFNPKGGVIQDIPIFNILFLISAVPATASQVYKEAAFGSQEINVNYMQLWVGIYQTLLCFIFMPINSLGVLGPNQLPLAKIPMILWDGTKCLFGINTISSECGGASQLPCDSCEGAWIVVAVYLFFNVLYNVFTLLVVKNSGAAVTFLVSTLRLPLSSLAFSIPFIMGADATQLKAVDILGLVIIITGLSCYRIGGSQSHHGESLEEESEAEDTPSESVLIFGRCGLEATTMVCPKNTSTAMQIRANYYARLRVGNDSIPAVPSASGLVAPLLGDKKIEQDEGMVEFHTGFVRSVWRTHSFDGKKELLRAATQRARANTENV